MTFPPQELVERLKVDRQMQHPRNTEESTFSAFAEFESTSQGGSLVKEFIGDSIVGHVSRDSTEIPAREKPTPKCKSDQKPMKRSGDARGRVKNDPRKIKHGLSARLPEDMTLEQMLDDLPKDLTEARKSMHRAFCMDRYKSISMRLKRYTSGLHSHLIPLAEMTAQQINLYECMDSAYVNDHSKKNVCIIDKPTKKP